MVTIIMLAVAGACFLLGAGGVSARVSWDELGKAFVVAAALCYLGKV